MSILERSTVGRLREALADYDPRTPIGFLHRTEWLLDKRPVLNLVPIDSIHSHIVDGVIVFASIDLSLPVQTIPPNALISGVYPYGEVPIRDLQFTQKTNDALGCLGIRTIRELVGMTKPQICMLKGIGLETLEEIVTRLAEYGLTLEKGESA